MTYENQSLDDLMNRCIEQTARYRRNLPHDTTCCFELLRRALALDSDEAFAYIYRLYEPQVRRWVHAHPQFSYSDETADFFITEALNKFYFATRAEKFARFSCVSQLMAYLKMCVHTAILQYIRDHQRLTVVPMLERPHGYEQDMDARTRLIELWGRICDLLPDEDDRLLARCAFVLDMKPAEIAQLYSTIWPTPRAVSVALQRIRRTLRRDHDLRQRADLQETPD